MKKLVLNKLFKCALMACSLSASLAYSADAVPVLFGKNNWLFTPYEFATPSDAPDTQATLKLLENVNKLFAKKGIALALVIVPSKIRIHADQLPENKPLDSYTADKYDNVYKTLRSGGVNVVNLNQAYLASPHRTSDTPIFLRLDTHWSPVGAMLAAETVKTEIDGNPGLKAALAATPEVKYSVAWAKNKSNTRARDLVKYLPADGPSFAPEQTLTFKVTRDQAAQAGLLGAGENVGITVIGSSYTNKNTGYPDGLRFVLQRDLLDISIPVDQGPWVGMEAYLRDEAFKTKMPKLIIWEIPEREMRSPPDNKFRDTRYISNNAEWLSRITDLLK